MKIYTKTILLLMPLLAFSCGNQECITSSNPGPTQTHEHTHQQHIQKMNMAIIMHVVATKTSVLISHLIHLLKMMMDSIPAQLVVM